MKTTSLTQRARCRGVALILVLAFIALLTAVILGFFSSTTSTRREVAQYEASVSVRQLSDMAANVVIGQITDATKSWEVPSGLKTRPGTGKRLTYITQPGLVRTYDEDGRPHRTFKLYSAGSMVERHTTEEWVASRELRNEVPQNWAAQPALYTDLNQPVLSQDLQGDIVIGNQRFFASYPILDPSGLSPSNQRPQLNATGQDGIFGFNINGAPGYAGPQSAGRPNIGAGYNPTVSPIPGRTGNPVPMPVQWMYVLQDGRLTSPNTLSNDGRTAEWSNLRDGNLNKPSKNNPIVGRIAFWTDDETAKLNPNVHSEGIAWDRSIGNGPGGTYAELNLRDRQPVKEEYQRYAGHPATVSLSPLFGLLPQYRVRIADDVSVTDYQTTLTNFYNLTPRVGLGGSKGGTATTYNRDIAIDPVVRDHDRLYASNDEVLYRADVSGTNRVVNPGLDRRFLERAKFFMGTAGRSAETNLFNQPRISLWMLQQEQDPNGGRNGAPMRPRNAKDELIAFCNTVGGFPYYFQRFSIYMRDPVNNRLAHRTIPFNQLPEYGYQPPSSQWPGLDWSLARNHQLYRYLQRLTSEKIPGFGGKFTDDYTPAQRDQILTQMVDILRLTNSYAIDPTLPPRYEYAPARQMPDAVSGETQIVPLIPPAGTPGDGTKGIGRFPTITEAMLVFYAAGVTDAEARSRMRIVFALEPFTPNAGSWTWSPLVRYVVRGLEKITINGQPAGFRPVLTNLVTSRCGYGSGGNHNTAHTGTFAAFRYWNGSGNDATKRFPHGSGTPTNYEAAGSNEETDYQFVSNAIPIDPTQNQGRFTFAVGGDGIVEVEVHSGYATAPSAQTLVQRVRLRFPQATLPVPRDSGADRNFNNRVDTNKFNIVNSADTVRSVEVDPNGPSRGDLRILSALKEVTPEFYAGYPGGPDGPAYIDQAATIIHSFRNGDGGTVTGGRIQSAILPGGPRGNFIAARGMNGATMVSAIPGDWDNGPNGFQDGAYINKPDDYYGSVQGDWYNAPTNTPNRQVSSGVVFGSLPTGVGQASAQPWRTLLFCPNPAAGTRHPGLAASRKVRDHLLLDFFTMPIVEPFAISEPLSTLGKVNLNYQIAPFTYITRATALHGVLKSTRIAAIPTSATGYKGSSGNLRLAIDPTETLRGFEERFNDPSKGGMFRSASQICDMYLVPFGSTLTNIASWWNNYQLTGDNSRESPYGQIYARTTTRSNTFTIHMRVQTLKKGATSNAADWGVWNEDRDRVTGEYRGSMTVERYVDLGDRSLPDFATTSELTLDNFYKTRIISVKKFTP